MTSLLLNARFRLRPHTGVERFASELAAQLHEDAELKMRETDPGRELAGARGHLWEQLVLPQRRKRGELLLSLGNTGPLAVKRQLVVIHDAAVWDHPEGFSSSFRRVYQELLPRLARRSALVATVSEFSRRRLAPHLGLPEEKILVLGNAAGPAFSPEVSRNPKDRLAGGPVLLCVASVDPRKNLERLLRVWLDLHQRGRLPEGARLQLIGGANPRTFASVEKIEGQGIEWLGRVDDTELIRRYRRADGFIFPSLYEGFGLPPLEAMACGCPVLLSRAASLPEVGGEAARYFDPESETDMAQAIEAFLALDAEHRAEARRAALERAAQFSWAAVAGRVSAAVRALG